MGAETSVVTALFFLVFLVVSVTTYSSFDYYKNLVENAQVDQDTMKKTKMLTEITITNVSFRNDSGNFYLDITLNNTGKTTLNASLLEVFIDGVYYPSYTLSTGNTLVPKNSAIISFYPAAAAGAIKIDNAGVSATQSSGTALYYNGFLVGSGTNRLLLVGLSYDNNPGTTSVYVDWVIPLTRAMRANNGNYYVELWYLINPPSGSHNIQSDRTSVTGLVLGAWSYTGVNQVTPIGNITNATGTSTLSKVDITTTVANSVLVDVETNQAASLTAGQTQRYQGSIATIYGGGSEMNTSTIGTYNMNWTLGSSVAWVNIGAELKPYMSNTVPPTVSRIKVVTENGISDYYLR